MKRIVLTICIVLLAVSIISASPPVFPSSLWGFTNAPVGSVITAEMDGIVRAETEVVISEDGKTVYGMNVSGSLADQNKDVTISIDGVNIVTVVHGWQTGTQKQIDLYIGSENPEFPITDPEVLPAPEAPDDAPTIEEPAQNIPAEETAPFIVETVTMANGVQYQAIAGLMCFDVL